GKKTKLFGARGPDELDFPDGTSNTLLVVEARDAVPWARPDELEYNPKGPLPQLGHPSRGGDFNAAMADGSVRSVSGSLPEATLRALITANGGEVIPDF